MANLSRASLWAECGRGFIIDTKERRQHLTEKNVAVDQTLPFHLSNPLKFASHLTCDVFQDNLHIKVSKAVSSMLLEIFPSVRFFFLTKQIQRRGDDQFLLKGTTSVG